MNVCHPLESLLLLPNSSPCTQALFTGAKQENIYKKVHNQDIVTTQPLIFVCLLQISFFVEIEYPHTSPICWILLHETHVGDISPSPVSVTAGFPEAFQLEMVTDSCKCLGRAPVETQCLGVSTVALFGLVTFNFNSCSGLWGAGMGKWDFKGKTPLRRSSVNHLNHAVSSAI